MKFRNKKIILPFIALILVAGFFVAKTFAQSQQNFDLTVSPVFFDFSSNPGDKITNRIRIRNNTTSDMKVKIGVGKMAGDVNGDLTLKSSNNDDTLSWINFNSTEITAKPLEWTDIPFTIKIPGDAAFGYYWAITFAQEGNGTLGKTGAALTGASAVPILLNVKHAGAKAEGKVAEFQVDPYVSEYLPVNFTVKIQNVGNIHIKPIGNVFIRSGNNKDLAILDINSEQGNIIPGTIRQFNTSWADGFLVKEPVLEFGEPKKDKNGNVIEKVSINWDKLTSFRIGQYTADLLLVFDDGTKDVTLSGETTFWVFPWKAVLIILAVLIFLIIALRFILKSYINRELKKREKTLK